MMTGNWEVEVNHPVELVESRAASDSRHRENRGGHGTSLLRRRSSSKLASVHPIADLRTQSVERASQDRMDARRSCKVPGLIAFQRGRGAWAARLKKPFALEKEQYRSDIAPG